eukprot:TRINITY_DN3828_c1_g1_i1.p1 TRINITY_DN3828_c1_g1~~TRINITY_DN3828_c1_g1_i1.p1  ORF type:complete len:358 (+),score=53.21 TRINITY_DN3828_c1_g1_i1:89-1162(+)
MNNLIPIYNRGTVKTPPQKPRVVQPASPARKTIPLLTRIQQIEDQLKFITNSKVVEEQVSGGQEHLAVEVKPLSNRTIAELRQRSEFVLSDTIGEKIQSLIKKSEQLPANKYLREGELVKIINTLATEMFDDFPKRTQFENCADFAEKIILARKQTDLVFGELNDTIRGIEQKIERSGNPRGPEIDLDKAIQGYKDLCAVHEQQIEMLGHDASKKLLHRDNIVAEIAAKLKELRVSQIELDEAVTKRNASVVDYSIFNLRSADLFENNSSAVFQRDSSRLVPFLSELRSLLEELAQRKREVDSSAALAANDELLEFLKRHPNTELDLLRSKLLVPSHFETEVQGGVFRGSRSMPETK